ncbi:hypothetical protein OAO01_04450 [Oligoflexia bacterium]|nr:hypothetical protein [Oligoflexia bacterium]
MSHLSLSKITKQYFQHVMTISTFLCGVAIGVVVLLIFAPLDWLGNIVHQVVSVSGIDLLIEQSARIAPPDDGAYHFDFVSSIIVLCGFGFMFRFLWVVTALQRSMVSAGHFLRSKFPDGKHVNTSDEVNELKPFFSENQYLRRAWGEFEQGVQYSDDDDAKMKVYIADEAVAFFNENTVVDSCLLYQFWTALPGTFTATGILGTFYGLVIVLQSFAVDSGPVADEAAAGISNIMGSLGGMHLAFYSSLFGVSAYILFTLVQKASLSVLSQSLRDLQITVDSIFQRIPEQTFLHKTCSLLEEQESEFLMLNQATAVMVETGRAILDQLRNGLNTSGPRAVPSNSVTSQVVVGGESEVDAKHATAAKDTEESQGAPDATMQAISSTCDVVSQNSELIANTVGKLESSITDINTTVAKLAVNISAATKPKVEGSPEVSTSNNSAPTRDMADDVGQVIANSCAVVSQHSEIVADSVANLHPALAEINTTVGRMATHISTLTSEMKSFIEVRAEDLRQQAAEEPTDALAALANAFEDTPEMADALKEIERLADVDLDV